MNFRMQITIRGNTPICAACALLNDYFSEGARQTNLASPGAPPAQESPKLGLSTMRRIYITLNSLQVVISNPRLAASRLVASR